VDVLILGVVAILVGNTARGTELVIGGIGFMVMKYILDSFSRRSLGRNRE